jgi:hypothetical protein
VAAAVAAAAAVALLAAAAVALAAAAAAVAVGAAAAAEETNMLEHIRGIEIKFEKKMKEYNDKPNNRVLKG